VLARQVRVKGKEMEMDAAYLQLVQTAPMAS